jgi:hypothetical protein
MDILKIVVGTEGERKKIPVLPINKKGETNGSD